MRIFLAGASGVIGTSLLPLLVEAGHTVAGTYYQARLPSPPRVSVARAARRTVEILDAPAGKVEVVE